MKKLLIIFFSALSMVLFSQEGISFEKTSFKEILAKAKKENKLVFVDAMASWCGPCKMMDKNVFSLKSVGDFYNKTFVNAKFDMEKGEGREIAAKYGVRSYPTYLFLNGDGTLISKNLGYMPESTFLELGKEAGAALSKLGGMRERFDKGEKDPEFLINIIKLNSETDYDFAKLASERYFKFKKDKEFTKDELGYLLFFIKSPDDANFKTFLSNKEGITKIFPEQNYTEFSNQIQLIKIMELAEDKQAKKINDLFYLEKATPLVGREEAEKSLNRLKLSYYELQNNFPEYEKAAISYYKNADQFEPAETLKAAWIFSEKATDPASLKLAQQWAEKSVMRGETAENTYILAKIYQKSGKKQEAKMYAEMSSFLAQSSRKDASLAKKLLEELK